MQGCSVVLYQTFSAKANTDLLETSQLKGGLQDVTIIKLNKIHGTKNNQIKMGHHAIQRYNNVHTKTFSRACQTENTQFRGWRSRSAHLPSWFGHSHTEQWQQLRAWPWWTRRAQRTGSWPGSWQTQVSAGAPGRLEKLWCWVCPGVSCWGWCSRHCPVHLVLVWGLWMFSSVSWRHKTKNKVYCSELHQNLKAQSQWHCCHSRPEV